MEGDLKYLSSFVDASVRFSDRVSWIEDCSEAKLALARIEAEHKRLASERDAWRERCHVMEGERDGSRAAHEAFRAAIATKLGATPVERATGSLGLVAERLHADSERLAAILQKASEQEPWRHTKAEVGEVLRWLGLEPHP